MSRKEIVKKNTLKEKRIIQIRDAVEAGSSIGKITEQLGLKEGTIRNYASLGGITLPRKKELGSGVIRRPELDALILQGLPLEEIAEKTPPLISRPKEPDGEHKHLSPERIAEYIKSTGQHELWLERRAGYKQKEKQAPVEIASLLGAIALEKCRQQEDLALEKALEYHLSRKRLRDPLAISAKDLYAVFKSYFSAQEKGIKISLQELSELSGVYSTSIGRVLYSVGLEAMYKPRSKTKKRVIPTMEQMEARERVMVVGLEMSYEDIAYFIKVPDWVIYQHFRKAGVRQDRYLLASFGQKGVLSYRTASQIYEALDLSFSMEEALELLDVSTLVLNQAVENRPPIERKIIEALDVIWPGQKHNKPYL